MNETTKLLARAGLALLFAAGIATAITSCVYEDESPPKPRTAFEVPRAPDPVRLARTLARTYSVFTDEELLRLKELCRSHGGRPLADEERVECAKHDPAYGFYGERLWVVRADDYPRDERHESLPAWVDRDGYRVVRVEGPALP
jgi:hypothetical protein